LKSGRLDAAVQGSETLPYFQKQEPNTIVLIGAPFAEGLSGIPVLKTEPQLRDVDVERVDSALHRRVPPGGVRAGASSGLLQLANFPILAVGEIPEIDRGLGIETGVSLTAVTDASTFIASKIDHRLPSRYAQAYRASRGS
jgi:hypothetical protein